MHENRIFGNTCFRQRDIIHHLQEEYGVDQQRIVSITFDKGTTMSTINDTLQSVNNVLAGFHQRLPAMIGIMEKSPNSRFVTHGKQQAIQDLILRLKREKRTRIGWVGNRVLLDTFLSFKEAGDFNEIHLVDDERTTTYYAQSRGIQTPLRTADINSGVFDAVVVDVALKTTTRDNFESLPKINDCRIYGYDPRKAVNDHRQFIAEQIANGINELNPDVLYVGHFAYFNLCKQSMALRKNGKKTAILLQIPNNMDFKSPYFDVMFTNYEDDHVFCHVLALLNVPLIHVQGWMALSYLPLLVKAAVNKAKIICEFNDISSLFVSWSSFAKIWNRETASLEQISEKALFKEMDGLIFNHNDTSVKSLMQQYDSKVPHICFHSYSVTEFFSETTETSSEKMRLVFIGTVNSSNLPKEYFGDVQLMHLIRQVVNQKIYFDIFLLPYQGRNNFLWDYMFLDNINPYFNLRPGLPPNEITHALTGYDYGVMFYQFDKDLKIKKKHLEGILPTKFFTFMEAGIPVIVSEELVYVAATVRKYGLGIVITQNDLGSLQSLIKKFDRETFVKNIQEYRQEHSMDRYITVMESFYTEVLDGQQKF